ncbi:MAG: NAD-dependent epimerase/dehydratase family protein [Alphaproteobacteria bacterium]|nr:NAD-dependent epimerase/dehydratase family protein [Alphaproteobacteria bacterium]
MVILVTGATGFVGSAVARKLLRRGEKVRALTRGAGECPNLADLDVERVVGDLRDPVSLDAAMQGVDSVYHVAADYRLWARNDREIFESNVVGTDNLIRAAMKRDVARIVYTSSVCTLGASHDGAPADETSSATKSDLIGAYKKSKFIAEKLACDWARKGAPIVIVNPSTPIGPRDIKPTPTGRMILEAGLGRIPAFVNTGLNFVHVDDVAEGHLLAHDKGRIGEKYILGGYNLSLRSLLWLIADMTDRKPPKIELARRAIYPVAFVAETIAHVTNREPLVTVNGLRLAKKMMYFSSNKAQRELGYKTGPLRRAIADALIWFGVEPVGMGRGELIANPTESPA